MTKEEYIDPSHVDDLVRCEGRNELLKTQNNRLVAALHELVTDLSVGDVKDSDGPATEYDSYKRARALLAELEVQP